METFVLWRAHSEGVFRHIGSLGALRVFLQLQWGPPYVLAEAVPNSGITLSTKTIRINISIANLGKIPMSIGIPVNPLSGLGMMGYAPESYPSAGIQPKGILSVLSAMLLK